MAVNPVPKAPPVEVKPTPPPAPNPYPGLSAFEQAIRQQESGGNYQASNPSGASGAYQFMPGTWSADATKFGEGQYAAGGAGAAPAAVQNTVATDAMEALYKQYGGNWTDVAEAWYGGGGGVANPNESGGAGYPTPAEYASSVMGLYNQYGGGTAGSSQAALDAGLGAQAQPFVTGAAQSQEALALQSGENLGQQQLTNTELAQQYQDTLASLGIQHTGLSQQGAYAGQQYGLQQQQTALSTQQAKEALSNLAIQHGYSSEQLVQQGQENLQNYASQQHNIISEGAGSGTLNTGTTPYAESQNLQQLQNAQRSLSTSEQEASQSYGYGQQQELNALKQLGLTSKGQQEAYTYQQQQLANSLKQLGLQGTQAQQQYSTGQQQSANTYAGQEAQILGQEGQIGPTLASQLQNLLSQLSQAAPYTGTP